MESVGLLDRAVRAASSIVLTPLATVAGVLCMVRLAGSDR
jgi:hypothetical protein